MLALHFRTRLAAMAIGCAALASACGTDSSTQPTSEDEPIASHRDQGRDTLATLVRQLTAARGIVAMPRPPRVRPALVQLGRMLAFDAILSGNRDISCMTCHLPAFAIGDERSLSIGQGGTGLGPGRVHPQNTFIPRNAPPAFNLHAMTTLFWDGRITSSASGVHTPAGNKITPRMARVFEFGALSALPLFPVTNRAEMRADRGNELAAIADDNEPAIWEALMVRLGRIPEYRRLFEMAYPGQRFREMTFAHASNAIGGFLASELAFANSPWDRFLRGDNRALTPVQLAGARNFMSARCSICHNGPAFSDNQFHNVVVAQLGPGQGDGAGGRDDFGRMRVTGNAADRYKFRTSPLRNVELTGPWGHDGAFTDLRAFVDHYSESDLKLQNYDRSQLEPLLQGTVLANFSELLATRDTLLNGVVFTPQIVDEVTAFMKALTDPAARRLQGLTPRAVPSGLPVDGAGRPR